MKTTIDKAGRVVIPKPIRDALGLVAGTEVDIVIDGVGIRLDGVSVARPRLKDVDGLLVIERDDAAPPLTDDDVREMRLGLQR